MDCVESKMSVKAILRWMRYEHEQQQLPVPVLDFIAGVFSDDVTLKTLSKLIRLLKQQGRSITYNLKDLLLSKDVTVILNFVIELICHFHLGGEIEDRKKEIIADCNKSLAERGITLNSNLTNYIEDGKLFYVLIDAKCPGHLSLDSLLLDKKKFLKKAFTLADTLVNIPQLIDANDILDNEFITKGEHELSLLMYLSYFFPHQDHVTEENKSTEKEEELCDSKNQDLLDNINQLAKAIQKNKDKLETSSNAIRSSLILPALDKESLGGIDISSHDWVTGKLRTQPKASSYTKQDAIRLYNNRMEKEVQKFRNNLDVQLEALLAEVSSLRSLVLEREKRWETKTKNAVEDEAALLLAGIYEESGDNEIQELENRLKVMEMKLRKEQEKVAEGEIKHQQELYELQKKLQNSGSFDAESLSTEEKDELVELRKKADEMTILQEQLSQYKAAEEETSLLNSDLEAKVDSLSKELEEASKQLVTGEDLQELRAKSTRATELQQQVNELQEDIAILNEKLADYEENEALEDAEKQEKGEEVQTLSEQLKSQKELVRKVKRKLKKEKRARVEEIQATQKLSEEIQNLEERLKLADEETETYRQECEVYKNDATSIMNMMQELQEEIEQISSTASIADEYKQDLDNARKEIEQLTQKVEFLEKNGNGISDSAEAEIDELKLKLKTAKTKHKQELEAKEEMLRVLQKRLEKYKTDKRRATITANKELLASLANHKGGEFGLPSMSELVARVQELENKNYLHKCSWREITKTVGALMEPDAKTREKLASRINW